jgi:hypothetical protein
MRIQVLHDSAGNICGIFAPVETGRKGGIKSPSPDRTVTEVDAPDITLPSDADQDDGVAAKLAYLTQHYQVVSERLVERSGRSAD